MSSSETSPSPQRVVLMEDGGIAANLPAGQFLTSTVPAVQAYVRAVHRGVIYNVSAVLPKFEGMSEVHLYCGSGVITQGGQP